jgi:hypothetical protein
LRDDHVAFSKTVRRRLEGTLRGFLGSIIAENTAAAAVDGKVTAAAGVGRGGRELVVPSLYRLGKRRELRLVD